VLIGVKRDPRELYLSCDFFRKYRYVDRLRNKKEQFFSNGLMILSLKFLG
jgi:hypothetical protein